MATEEVKLIAAVDSSSANKAKADLDAYTASATKADAATGKLAQTSRASTAAHTATTAEVSRAEQAASKYAETEAQAAARIHDMVRASLAARDATAARAAAEQAASAKTAEATAAEIAANKQRAAAQTAQMSAWTRMRAPVAQAEAILAKTKLTTAEVAKVERLLDKAQASGVITAGELAAAFKALDAAKVKDIATTEAQIAVNKRAGNSRMYAEAGTAVSEIASGNFGRLRRTGAAFLNQSGFFAKMFTPVGLGITAVVGSLAALAVAYAKGEAEQTAFARSLVMTGGYADKTSAQLQGMAKQLDGLPGVTEHAAAGVLAAVVATGKFTGGMVETVTKTALALEKLGEPVDKTIQQFEQLGKDPVQGLLKLNETTHFLTQTVYDQVTALVQRGREDQAAEVAQNAYASAMQRRTDQVQENLGLLQRMWGGVRDRAKEAWDAMLDIGRTQTVADKIAQVQALIGQEQKSLVDPVTGFTYQLSQREQAAKDARIKALQERLRNLQNQQHAGGGFEAGDALANRLIGERIAAQDALTSGAGAPAQTTLTKRLNDLATQKAKALMGVVDPDKRQQIIDAFNAQVAEAAHQYDQAQKKLAPHTTGSHANPLSGLSNMVAGLTNKAIGVQGDKALTDYVQGVAKLIDEYDKAIAKGGDVTRATAEYNDGIKKLAASLDEARKAQEKAIQAYNDSVDAEIRARQKQIDLQIASVGLSQREIQQMQAKAAIQTEVARKIEQLNRQRSQPGANVGFIDAEIAKQQSSLPILLRQQDELYAKLDALRGDWMTGVKTSWNEYIDAGKDVAGMTANVFNDAFSGMEDAMVNFVQTGKLSFKDLADSIISDLVRMETRILISKALSAILGSLGGGSEIDTAAIAAGNYTGPHALGGVFGGPVVPFARGGVVTKPTMFAFAKGTGLMGEAGPEAIMPLSRGPDGRLGVKAQGGGTTVIIENHSDSQAQVQQSQDGSGNDIIRVIVGQAVGKVNSEIMRGGSTFKAISQTFGVSRRGVPVGG